MKTTNFFTEISKFAEHADLRITISKKGDVMTATLLPELKSGSEKLMPFTASGTEHELDEGFIPEISKAIDAAGGFKTNSEQFTKAVKEHKEEEKEAEKKPAAKKPIKKAKAKPVKKVASAAKKSAPAAKKVASKVKSKPAPALKKKNVKEPVAPISDQPDNEENTVASPVQQTMF